MPEPHSPAEQFSIHAALSRRALMTGAATAAAVAAVASNRTGTAAAAPPAPTPRADPAALPLIGGPEFPIGLWWPPPPYESTSQRYAEIAKAGFTFVISGNYASDGAIFSYQLARAREAGLQMLVSDDVMIRNMSRWFTITDTGSEPLAITEAEAATFYDRARDAYRPSGSLAGFNLYDEPGPGAFPSLARAVSVARAQAPDLLAYINLFPSTDRNYYQQFVDQVRPDFVSYDRYPLLADGTDDPNYILNAAMVREIAEKADLPWWIFIQTLGYANHRTPRAAEMLWQVNQSLAYGAKGIQYFTYWTPDPARGEAFQPALITVDGRRTERWDHTRRINRQWLSPVGAELKPLRSERVEHAGEDPLPAGALGWQPDQLITGITGGPVIISRFSSTDPNVNDRWIFVANRRHDRRVVATIALGDHVRHATVFRPDLGDYRPVEGKLRVSLAPGAAALYRLSS